MDFIQIIGFGAAIVTTAANIPQAYKIIKSKSTKDISTVTYSMLGVGFALWITYGVLQQDYPIIIANGISLLVCISILLLKFSSKETLEALNEKMPTRE